MKKPRLIFCSYHCLIDPSSGAALSTRDLLGGLSDRGWACQAFCGPQLDFEEGESIEQILLDQAIQYRSHKVAFEADSFVLHHCVSDGLRCSIFEPSAARSRLPTASEGNLFLMIFERVVQRFRPDLVLTYGGHWLAHEVIRRARRWGLPVVFSLRNLEYYSGKIFRDIHAVLVPSRFTQEAYRQRLGLESTVIPGPWNWDRFRCDPSERRFVTMVNPQSHKGVFWFVRIAHELSYRRPDIPLLVVEGRGKVSWLAKTGLELGHLTSLHRMANTPDPRDFYKVSRIMLVPSLCAEAFGRIVVESFINGIPVLATNRGGLPEALNGAGFAFAVPERYTHQTQQVPTAEEIAPWVETVIRLWDDPHFYEEQRQRCLLAAEAFRSEILLPRFEDFFLRVLENRTLPY